MAARDNTTLRALVDQGLRQVLSGRSKPAQPLRLRDASIGGRGLHPEAQGRA